jgi:two-component system chemotaxis response regulator CheB
MSEPLRILVVDDSPTVRYYLRSLIEEAPDMTVVGEARDGQEAIALATRLKPDIISMDIQMPRLDGLAATRQLMQENPLPIVIVSGRLYHNEAVDLVFHALQAGALAALETPPSRQHADFVSHRNRFLHTLRAMAGVSVVRRWQTKPTPPWQTAPPPEPVSDLQVIVMGASAGGPVALYHILGSLPGDFPVPIAIVQHMADGFIEGLIRWLDTGTDLRVMQARQHQIVRPGEVVIAGGGAHLLLDRVGKQIRVNLEVPDDPCTYLPSVNRLFEATAETFGARALGVLLTGMGDDGAHGLLTMRQAGARTMVQNRETCLVFGMPGAAVSLQAAEQIVSLKHIAPTLIDLVKPIPNQ